MRRGRYVSVAGSNVRAAAEQPWDPGASQHIILMGDAPPHDDYSDDPRDFHAVIARASAAPLAVRIHTIGLTCDTPVPGADRRRRVIATLGSAEG